MIRTIRHKGLKRLFEQDDASGVNPEHVGKLRNILATLTPEPLPAWISRVYYSLIDWHHPDGAKCETDESAQEVC